MLRPLLLIFGLLVLPISLVERWLRENLWDHASYTNSAAIDGQLRQYRERPQWDLVFVGTSEVRWGVNPGVFDAELARLGYAGFATFNHAFDGFPEPWWEILIPRLFGDISARRTRHFVALGVQLTREFESFGTETGIRKQGHCGILVKPVLTSPFGIDLGLAGICRSQGSWADWVIQPVERRFWLLRYRSAVKSLLLPDMSGNRVPGDATALGGGIRGYEPHSPISGRAEKFAGELARWREDQYRNVPGAIGPLPPEAWIRMTAAGGYFDRLADTIRGIGLEPIFFAVPTHPLTIDFFQRREDYSRNTGLLRRWAEARSVIFVDLGIQDRWEAQEYYSDQRHVSYLGAEDFSLRLAREIAADARFETVLKERKSSCPGACLARFSETTRAPATAPAPPTMKPSPRIDHEF